MLRSVWEWKESFSQWYDCSTNVNAARLGFNRWLEQGENIDHPAVQSTLKTIAKLARRDRELPSLSFYKCDC
ncbi:hypothetical protein [Paenibacillus sp. 1781tsa1]|uniref:hypothetical protein n=1 Tax=Paenibacillus sp. 1781tsa1 TaxID=2953810 RepID=UPI0020A146D1|nr:hypothetical protein [Paenibacillus sp. 1781tsa1]MCP1187260.1 hypothetical protein [Paenibacillus sp. 1781tsa1]